MMISSRVTERALAGTMQLGLQANMSRMGELQRQLSSGKAIARPSDSPTGVLTAMQLRGQVRSYEQYSSSATDGLARLGLAETTLSNTLDQVRRVRELTLTGMSSPTSGSPVAREALAAEVDGIGKSLVGLANTRYLDRPVFGGTTAGPAAYNSVGGYVGDAGSVNRTVGDGTRVRVDVSGAETFGTGTDQLFAVLGSIGAHLRSDPAALGNDLASLDRAAARIQTQLSDVGARYGSLEGARQTADDRVLELQAQLSGVEDIDLPKTITEIQLQQAAYQAALAVTAKAVQPSLVDFLR